jgi:hypothetical protein
MTRQRLGRWEVNVTDGWLLVLIAVGFVIICVPHP